MNFIVHNGTEYAILTPEYASDLLHKSDSLRRIHAIALEMSTKEFDLVHDSVSAAQELGTAMVKIRRIAEGTE